MLQILLTLISVNYVTFDKNNKKKYSFVGKGEEIYLKRGFYHISIYGAQGGYGYGDGKKSGNGGKGMHITADFYITKETSQIYYAFVGEAGVPNDSDPGTITGPNRGGYNGGGSGGADPGDDDASGGGGGATDIRTKKNDVKTRLIVASGGSGGSWDVGAPGGDMCGLFYPDWNKPFQCSDSTNTNPTGSKTCRNTNGIGGRGLDQVDGTPSSGGGGGWCGGDSTPHFTTHLRPFVSDSGSSYVKKCNNNNLNDELCFFNVVMDIDKGKGNGMIEITRKWECKDSNCLFCKDAADKCAICKKDYYRYNGGCVSTCPASTINNGTDCFDCNEGCDVCVGYTYICTSCKAGYYLYHYECLKVCPNTTTVQGKNCVDCEIPCFTCSDTVTTCTYCIAGYFLYNNSCISECPKGTFANDILCTLCNDDCQNCSESADFCFECKENYYLFNHKCYQNCSDLNNYTNEEYYGIDHEEQKCQKCSDSNCIDCSDNYSICNECRPLYFLDETSYNCIHIPTNVFSYSNQFSNSFLFSLSSSFSNSFLFSLSSTFSNSFLFSFSSTFSNSFLFSLSSTFSYSKAFSSSIIFSNSNIFAESTIFTYSIYFTESNLFSKSLEFLKTSTFKFTEKFRETNIFSLTEKFSFSEQFTLSLTFSNSNVFTDSNIFTESMTFTTPFFHKTTLSKSISFSYILQRSVSFSISQTISVIYSMTIINNHISLIQTKSLFLYNHPYIINYYSLAAIQSFVIIEILPKKGMTKEMLIAICCGSASIFFFGLGLVIIIYQKFHKQNEFDDYIFSDEEENSDAKNKNINENLVENHKLSSDDSDIGFWL